MAIPKHSGPRMVAVAAIVVLSSVLLAALTMFPFQLVRNAGDAIEPAVADARLLVVNKLIYRIRDPRADEVVMLQSPLNPNQIFIKRVIAREGDTVRIVAGTVYIDGRPLTDTYVPAEFRSRDDWGPQVVPAGYYFVLGDRRNASSDSRHWGFVPKRYIIGKIVA